MINELNEIELEENNECDCCRYKTDLILYKARGLMDEDDDMLCDLCASTFISKIYRSKTYDYSIKLLSRSIVYIGNKILNEIREIKG